MVRNYAKKLKIQYYDNEIQHDLLFANNGTSIQVKLGICIVEIYVNKHSKR